MHFDLIQSLSLAGKASIPNDDRAGMSDTLAWMIDGATDLGEPGLVGPRGGAAWIASEADAAFRAAPDAPIEHVCRTVFLAVAQRYRAARTREPEGRWELPIAAFLAVRLGADHVEFGWLGDCVALLRRGDTVVRAGPQPDVREEERQRAAALTSQQNVDRGGSVIEALRQSRGRPGPLRVLGVEPEGIGLLEIQRLGCAAGDELLLMSDGFAALIDSYAAIDAESLMRALPTEGLAALALRLREIEADDGARIAFPRFKGSDDATALWLRIAG